jgi:hypothetical protein
MPDTSLWCVHVIGPDEVHAAPSFEAAERVAVRANERYRKGNDPASADYVLLRFVVALWPHSADSHAESAAKWEAEWSPWCDEEMAEAI